MKGCGDWFPGLRCGAWRLRSTLGYRSRRPLSGGYTLAILSRTGTKNEAENVETPALCLGQNRTNLRFSSGRDGPLGRPQRAQRSRPILRKCRNSRAASPRPATVGPSAQPRSLYISSPGGAKDLSPGVERSDSGPTRRSATLGYDRRNHENPEGWRTHTGGTSCT